MDDLLPGPDEVIKTDLQQFSRLVKSLFTWSPLTTQQKQHNINNTKHKILRMTKSLVPMSILNFLKKLLKLLCSHFFITRVKIFLKKQNFRVFVVILFEKHNQSGVL